MNGDPWDLPSRWRWQQFDEVARVASNLVDPALYPSLPHIAPNHIESGTGRLLPYTTVAADGVTSPKHYFRPGHVLYSKIRPYLAKAVFADFEGLCSADMYPIEVGPSLDARFLRWWMLTREFTRRAAGEQARTVLPKINRRSLGSLPVPIPPLEEQRRVVDILEDHISRIDAADHYLGNANTRCERMRESLISNGFAGGPRRAVAEIDFDGVRAHASREGGNPRATRPSARPDLDVVPPAPAEWPILSLEAATDPVRTIRYGILMPRVKSGGTVPYVEVRDLAGYSLIGKELNRTSAGLDQQFSGARLQGGDVVIAVRGSYERTAVVPEILTGANLSRDVARLAPLPFLDPVYLHFWLQTRFVRNYLHRHARGVAVKGVNIAALRALPIAVPDLQTQRSIAMSLQSGLEDLGRVAKAVLRARSEVRALERSLLSAAFSGRLTGAPSDLDLVEELAGV